MSDAFSPDVGQIVAPDGSVTYDFSGHISAQGIDLLAGTNSSPPNDRRVRWHKDPSFAGAVVAEILAYNTPFQNSLLVNIGGVEDEADFSVHTASTLGSRTDTIISSSGESSFLQILPRPANRTITFGSQAFAWDGSDEMLITVNHGLGSTPVLMIAASNNNNSIAAYHCYSPDPAQFTCQIDNLDVTPGAGTSDSFAWIAIG